MSPTLNPWQPLSLSVSMSLTFLVFLDSTYKWDCMVSDWSYSISIWLILLSIMPSRSIHVVANSIYFYVSLLHLLHPFICWDTWLVSMLWPLWIHCSEHGGAVHSSKAQTWTSTHTQKCCCSQCFTYSHTHTYMPFTWLSLSLLSIRRLSEHRQSSNVCAWPSLSFRTRLTFQILIQLEWPQLLSHFGLFGFLPLSRHFGLFFFFLTSCSFASKDISQSKPWSSLKITVKLVWELLNWVWIKLRMCLNWGPFRIFLFNEYRSFLTKDKPLDLPGFSCGKGPSPGLLLRSYPFSWPLTSWPLLRRNFLWSLVKVICISPKYLCTFSLLRLFWM